MQVEIEERRDHPRVRLDNYFQQELGPKTFVVCVLWVAGWTTARIAAASGRTGGSIRGIVNRCMVKPRDFLMLEERQNILDELAAIRQDHRPDGGYVLKDYHFAAVEIPMSPLANRAQPAAPPPEPNLRTRAGRKEAIRRRKEAARQAAIEAQKQRDKELGGAWKRGVDGSALEHLYQMLLLSDGEEKSVDAKQAKSLASKDRRKEAGLALRSYIDGCRVGGMSSVDFEREVAGGGVGLAIPAHRLECISALGAIKKMMPERDYLLIEGVVDRDEFPWRDIPSRTGKAFLYEAIRRALDVVAVFQGLMAKDTFADRWGYNLKDVDAMDFDDALSVSRQARQMFGKAQREAR
ncbi:hypothetical protein MPL3356_60574 [Mesorhizobium plurifarium]|uniref:Uncharacterized protein n=1 Tax=Mesorhizobium plurifarium TaxID=69974 RepID=A0A090EFE0_MESPL|nr:hypothetical protein MPL3356_60574 [Mesorhizobium plurifarium]